MGRIGMELRGRGASRLRALAAIADGPSGVPKDFLSERSAGELSLWK
jgi:hypothetical protein